MTRTPKLFIFDCGDVLFRENHVWNILFSALGRPDIRNVRELGENATRAVEGMLDDSIQEPEFWELVEKDFGKTIEWKGLLKKYYQSMIDGEVVAILERLKAKGFRVVAGTNVILPFYEINQGKGYYTVFQEVYASCFTKVSKPSPDFFLDIARKESVSPEDMFFTDDMPRNVRASLSLGIQTVRFQGAARLVSCLEPLL